MDYLSHFVQGFRCDVLHVSGAAFLVRADNLGGRSLLIAITKLFWNPFRPIRFPAKWTTDSEFYFGNGG